MERKVDLLVSEGGGGRDGKLTIPDVARRSEREAREMLTASGLRVLAVDKVYSPSMSEGMAIETRPAAGALARAGDGVRLKIATLQKPAGYVEPANGPKPETGTGGRSGVVVVKVPGQGDIFVGEGAGEQAPITEANPNLTVLDQETGRQEGGKRVILNPTLPLGPEARPNAGPSPSESAQPSAPKQPSAPLTPKGKVAKVHYQVPPLAQPLDLRIEKVDPSGKTVVLDRKARSGERVSLEVPYEKECVVTFYLGGEFVWQDKYR
ncbi:PASTA domain-containing protein [uncultured Fretibacterium sp.]|uniref:PASTA domain-containing protein n=1 Tax=uncultured Fretibacterium sp. TaxID=1678694 RepID=UPI00261D50A0|nr:PASTA domain-containing protein [uncultured Fretibacterium sp.]